jgi:AraC-like DNA-binding protein
VRLPPPPQVIWLGDTSVDYVERAPGPALAPWVQAFWRLRSRTASTLRVLPDGCMDIINGDVVGSLSSALVVELRAGEVATGVRFRPGAFTTLYGVPADELTDLRVPLGDVVRPRSLLEAARDADRPDPLAAAALAYADVRALARETGYSERQLRRRVLTASGHGPRRLGRIGRMQALLAAGRGESWARRAAEFGYFDEAHMINDVKALAGATPQTVLAERGSAAVASGPRDAVGRAPNPEPAGRRC